VGHYGSFKGGLLALIFGDDGGVDFQGIKREGRVIL